MLLWVFCCCACWFFCCGSGRGGTLLLLLQATLALISPNGISGMTYDGPAPAGIRSRYEERPCLVDVFLGLLEDVKC